MKKHLWWVAIVALGFALVGQYSYRYSELSKEMIVHVAYPPVASFKEVTNKASTIVQAEVISVQAGPDNVTQLDAQSGEPNQESRLPTQLITLRVQSAEKGNTAAGQELVVHRTGGQIQSPPIPARGRPKSGSVSPPGGRLRGSNERRGRAAGRRFQPMRRQREPPF